MLKFLAGKRTKKQTQKNENMEKIIQCGKKGTSRETALRNQREGSLQLLTGNDTCGGSQGSHVSSSSKFMVVWTPRCSAEAGLREAPSRGRCWLKFLERILSTLRVVSLPWFFSIFRFYIECKFELFALLQGTGFIFWTLCSWSYHPCCNSCGELCSFPVWVTWCCPQTL